jgi:hypothetical protein
MCLYFRRATKKEKASVPVPDLYVFDLLDLDQKFICTDPEKMKENLDFYCFVTFLYNF